MFRQPCRMKQASDISLDTLSSVHWRCIGGGLPTFGVPRGHRGSRARGPRVGPLRPGSAGQESAAENRLPASLAKPASKSPRVASAIDEASRLAGAPFPSGDATIGAFRRGICRGKHAVRCPVLPIVSPLPRRRRPVIRAQAWRGGAAPAPGAIGRGVGRSQGSGGPPSVLLSDATARYDVPQRRPAG